jgi:hypothetical protein
MIYCDTSFLLALYVQRDFFNPQALKAAAKIHRSHSLHAAGRAGIAKWCSPGSGGQDCFTV